MSQFHDYEGELILRDKKSFSLEFFYFEINLPQFEICLIMFG